MDIVAEDATHVEVVATGLITLAEILELLYQE